MIRPKHFLLTGLILFTLFFLGGVFLIMRSNPTIDKPTVGEQNNNLAQAQQLPEQPQKSSVHSGDGIMTLVMKTKPETSQVAYSFFVADISPTSKDKNERLLFTKTVGSKGEMSVSQNTWSPDNKYVFLREKDENGHINFLILKASGEAFANNEQYIDVGALLNQRKTEYFLSNATGWVSPTFLNVVTIDQNTAKKGPSYWFDVTSRSFLLYQ